MMKRVALFLAAISLAACNPSTEETTEAREAPHLAYTMTLDRGQVEPSLLVDLRFSGDSDGSTWLGLPNEWGGQEQLYGGLSDFEALSEGTEILPTDNPSVLEITHLPGADVHVRYRLAQDWGGVPEPSGGNPYRPVIQSDYVHLIGWATWALPQWDDWPGENPEVDFTLDWSGMPEGWQIADNFGVGRDIRDARSPLNRLQAGMFVAGDFRIVTRATGSARLNIAIRGSWPFGDNEFADDLAEVVTALRSFWQEDSTAPYLVTLIPLHRDEDNEGAISSGGTGLVDSFALFATTNVELESFELLAAHEFQHRWTPSLLGDFADPEEALYWFSEGFTDYYATVLLLRAGLIDLQGYADQTNEALAAYYRSPVRTAPVDQVVEWFWSDQDLQKLPYQRGRFIAARWNAALRAGAEGAASLDMVLFDLLAEGTAAREAGAARRLSSRDIVTAAANRSLPMAEADHQSFVVEGAMVPIEQGMFGPCFDVRDTEFPLWDIGFDAEASFEERLVIGVRTGGPAWNAGLREGMPFGGWSIPNYGDPNTDATFFVGIRGEVVSITYKPQGDETETIPQIYLPDDLSAEARDMCLVWLGAG
jgi:predicted metalloprotease with PDZ domain